MDLAYCKQCGRRVADEELEYGEAHVAENGDIYCNTCAIGLGLEVAVKAAPAKRRRRTRAAAAPARRGSAWPLLVLVAVILLGAGIPTALYIILAKSRNVPDAPPSTPPVPTPPDTPGPTPSPGPGTGPVTPAPPVTPRILTPAQVRALAKTELDKLKARSAEFEKDGLLLEAMEVYTEFPFKYRHTEFHTQAQDERRRLEDECEKLFAGTPERLAEMRARLRSAGDNSDLTEPGRDLATLMKKTGTPSVVTKIEELRKPLGAELARRLAPAMAGEGSGEIPWSFLFWRPGPGASAEWKSQTVIVTFADAENGRDLTLRLPPRAAWDLSGRTSLGFSTFRGPDQMTFVVEIATADGAKSSATCNVEGLTHTLDLGSLLLDLRRVTRITIALAEPAGREVTVGISSVGVKKK